MPTYSLSSRLFQFVSRLISVAPSRVRVPCFRLALVLITLAAGLMPSAAQSQGYSQAQIRIFQTYRKIKGDLMRYQYLAKEARADPGQDNPFIMQLLATTENELGLYNEAVRDFPLTSRPIASLKMPSSPEWRPISAQDAIASAAQDVQIVMVNEAHHDAHTRELTLQLLPRLRQQGYRYLAIEALTEDSEALRKRGYPIRDSGSEYLREPVYGEIVRQALVLGYKVVAYESSSSRLSTRDVSQAENIYRRILLKDPGAKVLVHAGYAHIDKAIGRLGPSKPMAQVLAELSGATIFSVDQTQFREQIPAENSQYQQLVSWIRPKGPVVLQNRTTGDLWSASPDKYDVNVLLPASSSTALISGLVERVQIIGDTNRTAPMLSRLTDTQRPSWLTLGGLRRPYAISTGLCKSKIPCLVQAFYAGETPEATAADRYVFVNDESSTELYLRPGHYLLQATSAKGSVLTTEHVDIRPWR